MSALEPAVRDGLQWSEQVRVRAETGEHLHVGREGPAGVDRALHGFGRHGERRGARFRGTAVLAHRRDPRRRLTL